MTNSRYFARMRLDARRFPDSNKGAPRFIGVTNKYGQKLREGDILSPTEKLGLSWLKGSQEIAVVDYTPEAARFLPFFYTVYGGEGGPGMQEPAIYSPPKVFKEWRVIGNVFRKDYNITGSFWKNPKKGG